jgi:hypothetical protein
VPVVQFRLGVTPIVILVSLVIIAQALLVPEGLNLNR